MKRRAIDLQSGLWRFLPIVVALFGPSSTAVADETQPINVVDIAAKAQAYLDEWTFKGEALCEAQDPSCPRYGDSLFNAAVAFQRAGERNKAIVARTVLINPRYHLDDTEMGKKALFLLGDDYTSMTEYARAADFYEVAARKASKASEAPDALVDATVFRLALGEIDRATTNAELYNKNYGAKKPSMAATLWMGIAASLIETNRFKEAKPILEKILPRVDKVGEQRDKFLAHAWFARVLAKQDDAQGAEREYGVVRSLWKSPEIQRRLMADAATNPRALGKVLVVVGEALFFFAEQKRKEADEIRYPEYKGVANKESVLRHINTKVVDWIKKKRPAIEEAEKAYLQVLELQPAPPPQWVVASSSRVGMMWAKFVTDFRAAPIPRAWKQHGPVPGTPDLTFDDLRKEYYERIDEAVEPQKQQAKAALKKCVDFSTKFQYADEFSRSCQVWLEKHYHKEFVHVDEFIPSMRAPMVGFGPTPILTEPQPSK